MDGHDSLLPDRRSQPVRQYQSASPYHETLRSFQALPLLDWGLVFKPHLWGFFILPPANAYSLYFLLLANAFLFGWALFLRQLRMSLPAAFIVSATLYFSPYIQAWWTTNAGAFALAPWVALAWMCVRPRWMRIVVSAYALAVWMISCAYPPFLYAEALAIAVMLIACRRDLLTLPRLLDAAAAALLGLLPFALYFRHLIPIMQATVYPGQREIAAGGISWARLLAQLWPGVTTRGYEPIAAVGPANAVNVTMLSTLLPIYALALTDVRSTLTRLWRANPVALLSVTTACGVLICWTFFWFPIPVARVIGLTEMLPKRAMLALGLILNITSSLALTRLPVQITRSRLALLGSITLAGALIKLVLTQDQEDEAFGWMDLVPWVCLTLILLHARLIRAPHKQASGVFAAALLGNVLTFGLFNPVQSAIPIFSLNRDAIQQHLMETAGARVSSEGTLIVPGRYGAVLAGVGLPTITHVLYYPQQAFFRRYFPDISSEAFDTPE